MSVALSVALADIANEFQSVRPMRAKAHSEPAANVVRS